MLKAGTDDLRAMSSSQQAYENIKSRRISCPLPSPPSNSVTKTRVLRPFCAQEDELSERGKFEEDVVHELMHLKLKLDGYREKNRVEMQLFKRHETSELA
jgi:hypothetical protein